MRNILPCQNGCPHFGPRCHIGCEKFRQIIEENKKHRDKIKAARNKQMEEDIFFYAIRRRVRKISESKKRNAVKHSNGG